MNFLFYFSVWALASAIGISCALGAREKKGGGGVQLSKAPAQPEPRDETGERVRGIIFDCYKELKKHTPGLDCLTACLEQSAIPKNVGLFALERTFEVLAGRYNTKPIETAINRLKSL